MSKTSETFLPTGEFILHSRMNSDRVPKRSRLSLIIDHMETNIQFRLPFLFLSSMIYPSHGHLTLANNQEEPRGSRVSRGEDGRKTEDRGAIEANENGGDWLLVRSMCGETRSRARQTAPALVTGYSVDVDQKHRKDKGKGESS
ncbi:uncharacterized protein LOC113464170 [Ceratina calcarata]|uniref:Uncharacterized protein LOC113464170 n=1 Tax=Ceratina calcarata TaxID=156304 RepID=A0AAJ7RYW1_9HYME|nr:uncharacterized protein LOC113464170 [Ceratina calcarata]